MKDISGIDAVIARQALDVLIDEPQTFAMLSLVVDQSLDGIVMFRVEPGDHASPLNISECPVGDRSRYAEHFKNIQMICFRGGATSRCGRDYTGCGFKAMLTVLLTFEPDSDKPSGYLPICRYTHPTKLGSEIIFLFHAEGGVALFIAANPDHEAAVTHAMIKVGGELTLSKLCCWCGRVAAHRHLKKCPCELSRYCDVACQNAHWTRHKKACTFCEPRAPSV